MTEHVLNYDHSIVPQERSFDCGPAATQVVLNALGINASEDQLIAEIRTTTRGTDDISWIENRCLDIRLPGAKYTTVYLHTDPPTAAQKDALWRNLVASINAGYGVIMNWVAPPGNKPRGVKGSVSPAYSGGTTYHYVAAMGYDDVERAVWIADSGFRPFGYWVSFDQAASLIPPKGYCFAAAAGVVATPAPSSPAPVSITDWYALAVIAEGRRRGITARGITIALATCLVESNMVMYANAKVPESLSIPHEAVGSDGYSVGLFQQQVVWGNGAWWWSDAKTCMDPTLSAGMFFERLAKLPYNDTARSPGSFAQQVQQSAFPTRYDEHWLAAQALYVRLSTTADPIEELIMSDTKLESVSIYAAPGEGAIYTPAQLLQSIDGMRHQATVEDRARLGDVDDVQRVARTAAGLGKFRDAATVAHAAKVLAEIEAANPEYLQTYLASKGIPA